MRLFSRIFSLWFLCLFSAHGDTIAFFYAIDADLQGLKTIAQECGQSVVIGSRRIQRLRLGSHTICAVKMGSGAVETAASAQALLTRFRCDWAFSMGPAGALDESVSIGSWHRVSRTVAWQHGAAAAGLPSKAPVWTADWTRFPIAEPPPPLQTTSALSVASGELFIASAGERNRLHAMSQARAVDMNSYGLALVCSDHDVPLFSWKVISDHADEQASEAFVNFTTTYSGEGGKALASIIQALPSNPNRPSSYPSLRRLLNLKPVPDSSK